MKRPRFFGRPGQLSRSPSPEAPEPVRMDDPFKELVSESETGSRRSPRSADGSPISEFKDMSSPIKGKVTEGERSPAPAASDVAKNVRTSPSMAKASGEEREAPESLRSPASVGSPRGSIRGMVASPRESVSPMASASKTPSPIPPSPINKEEAIVPSASPSSTPSVGSSLSSSVPSATGSPVAPSITGSRSPSSSVASEAAVGAAIGKSPDSPLPAIPTAPSTSPQPSVASSKGSSPAAGSPLAVVPSVGRSSPSTTNTGRGSPSVASKGPSSTRGSPAILAQSAPMAQSPLASQEMQEVGRKTPSVAAGSPVGSVPSSVGRGSVTFGAAKTPSPIGGKPIVDHAGEGAIDVESQKELEARKEESGKISTGFKIALSLLVLIIVASIVAFAIFYLRQ